MEILQRYYDNCRKKDLVEGTASLLPDELLHMIICYVGTTFHDILHFSTICKRWKHIGDCSILWLRGPLIFYCPDSYCKLRNGHINTAGKRDLGDKRPFKINLGPTLVKFPADRYKMVFEIDSAKGILVNKLPSEQANEVRKQFMQFYLKINKLWHWHTQWRLRLQRLEDKSKYVVDNGYAHFCGIAGLIAQILAANLLSDLTNLTSSSSHLTSAQHGGFMCVFFVCIIFILFFLTGFVYGLNYEIKYPVNDLSAPIKIRRILPFIQIELIILGILSSVIMLYSKLVSNDPAFFNAYIPIPMWIFFLLAFGVGVKLVREERIDEPAQIICFSVAGLAMICVPLTFTLIGLYYDSPDHSKLSSPLYATIPLCLPALGLILVALVSMVDNYEAFKAYWRNNRRPRFGFGCLKPKLANALSMMFNITRTAFIMGMTFAMFYFIIMLALDQLPMGDAAVMILLWSTCLYCSLYSAIFGH